MGTNQELPGTSEGFQQGQARTTPGVEVNKGSKCGYLSQVRTGSTEDVTAHSQPLPVTSHGGKQLLAAKRLEVRENEGRISTSCYLLPGTEEGEKGKGGLEVATEESPVQEGISFFFPNTELSLSVNVCTTHSTLHRDHF